MDVNPKYKPIADGPGIRELPPSVEEDLSTDQKYGYRIVNMIRSGKIDTALLELAIGPVCHSRWLTTANRLLRVYVSKHGLKGKQLKNLNTLAHFICVVYYVMWFDIKCRPHVIDGPRHVVKQIQLVREFCSDEAKDIVTKYVETSAWLAHSEPVLLACLASDDEEERRFAVKKVLELRGDNDSGDLSVRSFRVPEINWNVTSLRDLTFWSDVHEPCLTCGMSRDEIRQCLDKKLVVPSYPCHGQSIERCVKQVTMAAKNVFGQEARDGFIRAGMKSRELLPVECNKKDFIKMLSP